MMKIISFLVVSFIFYGTLGCDKPETAFYQKLKNQTGATDEELRQSFSLHADMYVLLNRQIQDGSLTAQDLEDSVLHLKQTMATISREDELAALMTLRHLRLLESKGADEAKDSMVKQLSRFVESEHPSSENSRKIRTKILEYAKTSEAFKSMIIPIEQGTAPARAQSE